MIWKIGNHPSQVVSDVTVKNTNFPVPPNKPETGHEDIEYYGGHLVCESVANIETAKLITAAPDLLEACNSILQTSDKIYNDLPGGTYKNDFGRSINQIQRAVAKASK